MVFVFAARPTEIGVGRSSALSGAKLDQCKVASYGKRFTFFIGASNPGCVLQIESKRRSSPLQVAPVDLTVKGLGASSETTVGTKAVFSALLVLQCMVSRKANVGACFRNAAQELRDIRLSLKSGEMCLIVDGPGSTCASVRLNCFVRSWWWVASAPNDRPC